MTHRRTLWRGPAAQRRHERTAFLVCCGVASADSPDPETVAVPDGDPADGAVTTGDGPDSERRAETRRPITLKVEYKRLNTFFADYTKNISRGGTFIKTTRPLPIGTEFLFKLFIPGKDEPFTIHGEVQRIIDGSGSEEPGMAIKFVYREGHPQDEIARTVEGMMTDSLGARLSARLIEQSTKRRG